MNKWDHLFTVNSTDSDVQTEQIDNQKQIYGRQISQYNRLVDYKDGMVVQSVSPVASISTENDEFYITANVAAADRSRIAEGNKADIEVSGLQQNIGSCSRGCVKDIMR